MTKSYTIPVRVVGSGVQRFSPGNSAAKYPEAAVQTPPDNTPEQKQIAAEAPAGSQVGPATANTHSYPVAEAATGPQDTPAVWRDRALRLQADMDNFRKRQQRLAQEQIDADRQRLLTAFVKVVDDLERALQAPPGDGEGVRRGIELTHHAALQLLRKEGVEPISAMNQPFDPAWHEAVTTVAHDAAASAPDTVVQVMEQGYRIGDRLLRAAKVAVAV